MKKLLLIALVAITAVSCQKQPEAEVSADKKEVETNEMIQFSNSSVDAHSFLWNFGDGETSTEKNPSKSYDKAGTYSVKMIASSKNGKKDDEAVITITVKA
ncbi:MAG: PKD domain-containing protein, partial [Bacteroidetes bacterium]|nr:PKD domain-containing protein [Bacteroidota bacterium]